MEFCYSMVGGSVEDLMANFVNDNKFEGIQWTDSAADNLAFCNIML